MSSDRPTTERFPDLTPEELAVLQHEYDAGVQAFPAIHTCAHVNEQDHRRLIHHGLVYDLCVDCEGGVMWPAERFDPPTVGGVPIPEAVAIIAQWREEAEDPFTPHSP